MNSYRMISFSRLKFINPFILILIFIITMMGIAMLYSAANGAYNPWAVKQLIKFIFGFILMLVIACVDIRFWFWYGYIFYGIALLFLFAVELLGFVGMGAQRWIDLYAFTLQPSELMRLGLILALARYFHSLDEENISKPFYLIVPALLILIPALLVLRQPDLGTATLLLLSGTSVIFAIGVRALIFIIVGGGGLSCIPILWNYLHDYQKKRVLIFLDPESDPTHSGYHIMQSKIALGSGGIFGKGFLQGSQSHLNFLPEKQTDFIFTMFCEEFGFVGALVLISLYMLLIALNLSIAFNARTIFGRLVAIGFATTFFLYMFINMAMVTGLLPVVGVPLPLFSYGGTAMLTLLICQGIILSVGNHQDVRIGK